MRHLLTSEQFQAMQAKVRGQQGNHLPLHGANDGPVPNETGNAGRNSRMARNKDTAPVALRGKSVNSLVCAGRGQAYSPEAGHVAQLRTKESARSTNAGARPAPSPTITYILTGQCPSGKNQVQMLWRNGKVHRYPNKTFTNWRAQAYIQILEQRPPGPHLVQVKPVRLTCLYTPSDRITRDVSGQLDAVFSLLVYAKVLKDDGLVHDVIWHREAMNRKAPKLTLTLLEEVAP